MSSPSCVSHVDSTSICAADASLDMSATRYGAKALAEQSAPPSLQAFLADTAGLEYRKEIIDVSQSNLYRLLSARWRFRN